jgi:hypothetical protein
MKTLLPLRIKGAFAVLVLLLVFASNLLTQPQHYNYNTTGAANSFPWNIVLGKEIQVLFLPGDFNQPSPAPSGNITSVSFRLAAALGPYTYSNVLIKMGQAEGLTSFAASQWYAGPMDTVYYRASVSLGGAANEWMTITLDEPFSYDNTKSLIVGVQQCAAPGATGFSTGTTTLAGFRRNTSLVNTSCPFAWGQQSGTVPHMGINVAPAAQLPDLLYYKFENNPTPLSVINCGIPGVGTPIAPLGPGTPLGSGGQFDSCITGTNLTTGKVTTGWNTNLGTSSWTISMWLTIPTSTSGSAYYLFGDAGSGAFRCFHNGVAGQDNLVLRGTGITDVTVTGIGPNPTVVTFVYDSAAGQVRAYKDGVLAVTVPQTLNIVTGTGFHVGGYGTSTSFGGKMDEFRMYRRALSPAEITATWNTDIGDCSILPVTGNNNEVPQRYRLEQNYPNPFNPSTIINFSIPSSGMVDLRVFDILGREVAVLVNGMTVAGNHTVPFDASTLATGVYFYTLVSGDFRETKKMLMIK